MKKFVSTMRKGFHMTFENGLTVSVQWGGQVTIVTIIFQRIWISRVIRMRNQIRQKLQ